MGDQLKTRDVVNSSIIEGSTLWNWVLCSGLDEEKNSRKKKQDKTKKFKKTGVLEEERDSSNER